VNLSVNVLISRRISLARHVLRLGTMRSAVKDFSQKTLRENTIWKKRREGEINNKIDLTCIALESMGCICLAQFYCCEYGKKNLGHFLTGKAKFTASETGFRHAVGQIVRPRISQKKCSVIHFSETMSLSHAMGKQVPETESRHMGVSTFRIQIIDRQCSFQQTNSLCVSAYILSNRTQG